MFRAVLSLTLVLTQFASGLVCVCTAPNGRVGLDLGAFGCRSCQPEHACCHEHHADSVASDPAADCDAHRVPCECRHELLIQVSQRQERAKLAPAGSLLMLPLPAALFHVVCLAVANERLGVLANYHTPLAERASVCLRC